MILSNCVEDFSAANYNKIYRCIRTLLQQIAKNGKNLINLN